MACDTIDISAGYYHNLYITSDSGVYGIGRDLELQLTSPITLNKIKKISAGGFYSLTTSSEAFMSISILNTGNTGIFSSRLISINNLPPGLSLATSLNGLKPINTGEIAYDSRPVLVGIGITGLTGLLGPLFKQYQPISTDGYGVSGIFATGDNTDLQCTNSNGLTGINSVFAGTNYSIGLFNNKTVTGWGINTYGQNLSQLQSLLTGVKSLATKSSHTLVLFENDIVSGFGLDSSNQSNGGNNLTGISGISVGSIHSLALLKNGKVTGWGSNLSTQVSGTTGFYDWNQTPVGKITGAIQVSAGSNHSMVLLNNGTITGFGDNSYSKITGGYIVTGITKISAGENHTIALLNNKRITGWGNNSYNQVQGSQDVISWSGTPAGLLTGVVDINTSYNHNLALLENGRVTGWGLNLNRQISNLYTNNILTGVTNISAGYNHSLFALKAPIVKTFSPGNIPAQVTGNITGFGITGYGIAVTGYNYQNVYLPKPVGINQNYEYILYTIQGTPTLPGTYNTYLLIDELGNDTEYVERYITFTIPNDKRFPMLYKVCGGATLGFVDKRLT
jgi:alpha-tubulin suppressor-like RCC1 family protein